MNDEPHSEAPDGGAGTDTRLVHEGRDPARWQGAVNPPVFHTSTVLLPDSAAVAAALRQGPEADPPHYGRHGTPTTRALEAAVAALEGGTHAVALPSGLAACTMALLAVLKPGDQVLVADSVYYPTRAFCDRVLRALGIGVAYYDPLEGANIARLFRPETRAVFTESPGSLTFEVQDLPAIAEVAHRNNALVLLDNTWSAGYYFQPFEHGVDVSIQAATKYIVGHADAMLGVVTTRSAEMQTAVRRAMALYGMSVGASEAQLGLRGLRSLAVRLARHQESGLAVARWLLDRPEVKRVLHPALPDCPGHTLWQRDFTGASGLFAVELAPVSPAAVAAMLDHMRLFGMGFSWGGYESLILPSDPTAIRTATSWTGEGPLLRLHVGLEDVADLTADLEDGFARLRAAGA